MYTLAREATAAKAERDTARAEMDALQGVHERHNAAIELLGEREERIAELEADMKVRAFRLHTCLSRQIRPSLQTLHFRFSGLSLIHI